MGREFCQKSKQRRYDLDHKNGGDFSLFQPCSEKKNLSGEWIKSEIQPFLNGCQL